MCQEPCGASFSVIFTTFTTFSTLFSVAYEKMQRGGCGRAQNTRHFRPVCWGKAEKVVKLAECHAGQGFPHTPFFSPFFARTRHFARRHAAAAPGPRTAFTAFTGFVAPPRVKCQNEGRWLASTPPPRSLVASVPLDPSEDTVAPKHPWQATLAMLQQRYS